MDSISDSDSEDAGSIPAGATKNNNLLNPRSPTTISISGKIRMNKDDSLSLFKGAYFGMKDKNGNDLHEGDYVRFYYKGEFVACKIIYEVEWGMFCLQWPDGYKNKHPLNPDKYERVKV